MVSDTLYGSWSRLLSQIVIVHGYGTHYDKPSWPKSDCTEIVPKWVNTFITPFTFTTSKKKIVDFEDYSYFVQ